MAANPAPLPNTTTAAAAASSPPTAPSISPIKKTTTSSSSSTNKSSTAATTSPSTTTSKKQSTKKKDSSAVVDNVKFTSSTTKKSSSKKSSSSSAAAAVAAANEKQLKLQKSEIAKRELNELEAMERAFREDMEVWHGPNNVVFPRRYHSLLQLKHTTSGGNGDANSSSGAKRKKKGDKDKDGKEKNSSTTNSVYYGSQSQGWMYGDGLAKMGGLSWMDVTSPPAGGSSALKRRKSDNSSTTAATAIAATAAQPPQPSSSGFLMDDVSIIDKSLTSAGLTRSHLTPRAYACLLEQARRYTLEVLADAQDYALHASRDSMASLVPADLLLAVEMREDTTGVSSTLPRVEDVQYLAEEVNRVPLPAIPRDCYGGVILPPVEDQLTARTFDVVNGARVVQRMMRGGDYPMGLGEVSGSLGKKGGGGGGRKVVGSYGAGIGRQISVNLIKSGAKGGDEKSKGGVGVGGTAAPASAPAASGSKGGQKRRLTEL